jgi:hypothetical protein
VADAGVARARIRLRRAVGGAEVLEIEVDAAVAAVVGDRRV